MKVLHKFIPHVALTILFAVILLPAYAEQDNISDSNIGLALSYPDILMPGKQFVLSSVVTPTVDQVSNITVTITCPELAVPKDSFHIDKLAKDSSFGSDFNATLKDGVPDGSFVANVKIDYFVKGLFDSKPVENTVDQTTRFFDASKPSLILNLQPPNEAFSGEPIPIRGTLSNQGATAYNVKLSLSSPQLMLEGNRTLTITELNPGRSIDFDFVVSTQKNIGAPVNALMHVNGTYSDGGRQTYPLDNSFNLFVRQRGLLELGDASGIWIGQFFIAPVVGIGTIVSSVIGFMIFIWNYRNRKKKRRIKKTSKPA